MAPVAVGSELRVGHRAEAAVAALLDERLVQEPQDLARAALEQRGGAHRVARQRGHGRGLGPLAADVADQGDPRVAAHAEDVVEVAAHLDPLAGRREPDRRRQLGDGGQGPRQQVALQDVRDRALPRVELGVDERRGDELAELVERRLVAAAEAWPRAVEDLEQPEVAPAAVREPRDGVRAGLRALVAGAARRGGRGEPARLGVLDPGRHDGARRTRHRARPGGGALEDLLHGERRVDRQRGLRERVELLRVLALHARDLLDRVVAAVGDLERRQALAQHLARGGHDVGPAAAVGAVAQHAGDRRVVGLDELEDAELGRQRLAAERVRGAQPGLVRFMQVRAYGGGVAGWEIFAAQRV